MARMTLREVTPSLWVGWNPVLRTFAAYEGGIATFDKTYNCVKRFRDGVERVFRVKLSEDILAELRFDRDQRL